MNNRVASLVTGLWCALVLGSGAHAEPPAARPEVGRAVQAAQALMKQHRPADALAKLREADAVRDKSPYETYVIAETRAAAEMETGDFAAAAAALRTALATGILTGDDRLTRLQTLVQIDYQAKAYGETVADGQLYYKDGGRDPLPRTLMAQAAYTAGDWATAASLLREIVDMPAARPPDANLFLALVDADDKLHDAAGRRAALERLVGLYPQPRYWMELLGAVRAMPAFPRRLVLDLDRLAAMTGAMTDPRQYTEAAERALDAGFPGDAVAFLQWGYDRGVLGTGPESDRQRRLLDTAKRQAAADMATLDQQAREANAAANGLAAEKLGEAYASYGRYEPAIAALETALKKGGLDARQDALLHLVMACTRAGQTARAKTALGALPAGEPAGELARLWLIEASRATSQSAGAHN